MHLTLYTDYSLRLLLYLSLKPEGATIAQVAKDYNISRNHLVKVAHALGVKGYIQTFRGRTGGLKLARDPESINVGRVVRDMEPNFYLVECFHAEKNRCVITPACDLKRVLYEAHTAFLKTLDAYTLGDLSTQREALLSLLNTGASED